MGTRYSSYCVNIPRNIFPLEKDQNMDKGPNGLSRLKAQNSSSMENASTIFLIKSVK